MLEGRNATRQKLVQLKPLRGPLYFKKRPLESALRNIEFKPYRMQGMMLGERPSSIATGMVDSSISIGNYKGVMLCNRPFGGVAASQPGITTSE
jgi:hypothetical protein